jgi:hypothetical protein
VLPELTLGDAKFGEDDDARAFIPVQVGVLVLGKHPRADILQLVAHQRPTFSGTLIDPNVHGDSVFIEPSSIDTENPPSVREIDSLSQSVGKGTSAHTPAVSKFKRSA